MNKTKTAAHWTKNKLILAIFLLTTVVNCTSSCSEKKQQDVTSSSEYDELTTPFIVPDSIDTALLIAMFDENDPPGHSVLIYEDNTKTSAKKIKYLGNRSVLVEKLTATRYRELKSNATNTVYLIKEKSVTSICGGTETTDSNYTMGNLAVITEHRRTDTHLREYNVVIKPSSWK